MKTQVIAIAAAMAFAGAAFAQTGAPASTAPTSSQPGQAESGSSMTPGMDSSKATGSTAPTSPNGYPAATGKSKGLQPDGTIRPYVVPGHPNVPSGDDGSTAGKTNPD
ncbi:MAG TPA: hypothetical protein VKQ29_07565 [Aliidongia sp.]|nr:hypothetical protein [Aliidongia sp.]